MLARLARAENSYYGNNATGKLLGLFRIGPRWAATEASPSERLPALRERLEAEDEASRRLGLQAAKAALEIHGGFRIIGPEYQGIKPEAVL